MISISNIVKKKRKKERHGGGGSLGSRRIFPMTIYQLVCATDKGSLQGGGGRWLLVTSLGVMAAVIF